MRRLCIFYNSPKRNFRARDFVGKKIEWIVCKECQRKIQNGNALTYCPLYPAWNGFLIRSIDKVSVKNTKQKKNLKTLPIKQYFDYVNFSGAVRPKTWI